MSPNAFLLFDHFQTFEWGWQEKFVQIAKPVIRSSARFAKLLYRDSFIAPAGSLHRDTAPGGFEPNLAP